MIFMALRALQVVALIILIGLTARHVSYMMVPGKELPKTLAATLALVSEKPTHHNSHFCLPRGILSQLADSQ